MSFLQKIKENKVKTSIILIVIASIGIGGYFLSKRNTNTNEEVTSIVETYTIADNEKVFINGSILPTKSKDFNPTSQGEVSKMNATNGKIVKEGELLYTTKNQSVIDEIESLKSQVDALKKTNVDNDPTIKAEITKLEGQISLLDKKASTDTNAPFAGKIYLNETTEGDESQTAAMTLVGNEFYMKGQVSEQDLPKLQVDDPVEILILSTNKKVAGRISFISDRPSTNNQDMNTGAQSSLSYYDISIAFDSQENLVNGFHTQATIEIKDSICKVPTTSIQRDENDKPYVFEVLDGILKKQIVEIQSTGEEITVIKGGLDKKDIIVRYALPEMKEGDLIPTDAPLDSSGDMSVEELPQESEGK